MGVFEYSNCDICDSDMSKPLIKYDYLSFPCNVSICMSCGLVKLNPRWLESKYDNFYKHKYDLFNSRGSEDFKELFENDLRTKGVALNDRLKVISFPEKIKMLDIGCGTGYSFFSLPKKIEVDAFAIEPSLSMYVGLKSKGVEMIGHNSDWGHKYDLVIARHTLEHTLSPVSFLSKIKKCLKDNGIVYIVVPNTMYFNSNKSHSFFRNVHTYYFNLSTLAKISTLAGLSIVTQSTGSNESANGPVEIWTILKKDGEQFNIPEISPNQQLSVVKKYVQSSHISIKRRIKSILRRVYYRA